MNEIDNDQTQKPHQNVQNREKDPIPLVMRIIILFNWRMEPF